MPPPNTPQPAGQGNPACQHWKMWPIHRTANRNRRRNPAQKNRLEIRIRNNLQPSSPPAVAPRINRPRKLSPPIQISTTNWLLRTRIKYRQVALRIRTVTSTKLEEKVKYYTIFNIRCTIEFFQIWRSFKLCDLLILLIFSVATKSLWWYRYR